MGHLLLVRGFCARRRRRRLLAALCSFMVGAVVAGIGARWWMGRSLLAQRLTLGGEAAGYEYFVLGNPEDVIRATHPGLVLEGGGTDIDESFEWMIERSGGGDFVVLRTTGSDAYNDYIFNMQSLDGQRCDSAATLIITSRAASFDPFVIETIRGAEALWLAGGDQAKHVATWRGTPVADAINDLVARGVPLGGTSSGLAVMGELAYSAEADGAAEPHLSSTQALRDPFHPRITIRSDFLRLPHLDGLLLEPHFLQESRYGRMAARLARVAAEGSRREVRGIGIDKKTALLVEPDGSATVISSPDHPFGRVTLFRLTGYPKCCQPGRPLTVQGIEAIQFGPGDRPNLAGWRGQAGTSFDLSVDAGVPTMTRLTR
jgi:cyanophycinase-like exopeptidase